MTKFKKDFMIGAATAAHQVEGNNVHSDYWAQEHIPYSSFVEPSLDAVDHYNRYEEDIKLMAQAGLNTYRFSIEWARIQPEPELWIDEEVDHYRKVLDCCIENGVTPVVTMHHFTSPKWLISQGGWEQPETVDKFTYYCKRLVTELGDKLEYVCTINEANMRLQLAALIKNMTKRRESMSADNQASESDVQVGINMDMEKMKLGMIENAKVFGIQDPTRVFTFISQCTPEGDLLVMKAHESARDAMKEICPHLKVGLTLSLHDLQAYPGGEEVVAKEWDEEFQHYLPYFQNDDFFGVQCYSRKRFNEQGVAQPEANERKTQMGYEDYPIAIANVVRKVAKEFSGELIVTENGIATADDKRRIEFIDEATTGLQECINDGINVTGYLYWSLLDNFEWQKGYGMTFGLIGVDRATQTRQPKESLHYLGTLMEK